MAQSVSQQIAIHQCKARRSPLRAEALERIKVARGMLYLSRKYPHVCSEVRKEMNRERRLEIRQMENFLIHLKCKKPSTKEILGDLF